MTTVYCIRTRTGLEPEMLHDEDELARFVIGARVRCEVTQPRSIRRNSFYWALLSRLVRDTALSEHFPDTKRLHQALLLATGYTTPLRITGEAEPVMMPNSTAFDAMSEEENREYVTRALAKASEWVGFDVAQLVRDAEGVA